MTSQLERLSPTKVRLTVEVPVEELQPSIEAAFARIAKQVNIPGFRKGKVPARIIEQRFGRAAVLDEAVQDAVPRAYDAAVDEHGIVPVAQPQIEVGELADGSPLSFTAEVEIRPNFELPDLASLRLEVAPATPSDREVDEQIDALRGRFATLREVDRASADGDVLLVDLAGETDGGDAVEDLIATALSYELGTDGMLPGFDEAVRGAAKGEERSFTFTPQNGDWAGVPLTVRVEVKAVRERDLPAIDDDFAAMASEFDTAAELRDDIRTRLARLKRLEQGAEARARAHQALIAAVDMTLPEGVVAAEVAAHFQDGHDSGPEHRAEVEAEARDVLKGQYIADRIAEEEQISVEQAELSAWLIQQAPRYGMTPEALAKALVDSGQVGLAMQDIKRTKALALVMQRAQVVDTEGNAVDLAGLDADLAALGGRG